MAIPIVPIVTGALQMARSLLAPVTPQPSGTALDQEAFLRLLVAELRNQDPLQPLGNEQFIQQTAALSQVQELTEIRQLLQQTAAGAGGALAAAAGLLGRRVTATAASFTYAGATVSLPVALAAPARAATLEVLDASDRVVVSVPLGALPAGARTIPFPPSGTVLPAGSYRYRITDLDALGRRVPVALASGTVTGVTLDAGQPLLLVNGSRVRLSDLAAVDAAA